MYDLHEMVHLLNEHYELTGTPDIKQATYWPHHRLGWVYKALSELHNEMALSSISKESK